jgi:hypothetical protein
MIRIARSALVTAALALTVGGTSAQKPQAPAPNAKARPAAPASGAGMTPNPRPASVVPNQGKAPVTEVIVETRPDGLAYLPGATQPFNGKAITASKTFEDCVESITPYKAGRLHGEVMVLYKAGNPRTVRTYVDGVPKSFAAYYQDGAQKFQQTLNARDKAEGPYRRWFPNGRVQADASYDSEERWHGDNKQFNDDGTLKSHYVYDHGVLKQIVFETPAAKAEREAPPKPATTRPK